MRDKILSIIIPVYNVEQYIRSCICSVLNQDIDKDCYEIILIDDGTPDRSIEMIADIIKENPNIQVIHQHNMGLSATRNVGVRMATGKYILFVDSDDILVENSLKALLNIASSEEVDLIVADYHELTENSTEPIQLENREIKNIKVKTGRELFMEDLSPDECYVWRTLYRKKFLTEKKIEFIEGITFEDIPFTHECYLKADKGVRVSYPFYLYRKHHGTISTNINEKTIFDLNISLAKIWNMTSWEFLTEREKERLQDNFFATFSKCLWYISHNKNLVKNRKAYISDLKSKIPDLKLNHGLKQRFVSMFFNLMPSTYIKIRSLI